jgi:hypothetical protein
VKVKEQVTGRGESGLGFPKAEVALTRVNLLALRAPRAFIFRKKSKKKKETPVNRRLEYCKNAT